jgi:hypothetical protein
MSNLQPEILEMIRKQFHPEPEPRPNNIRMDISPKSAASFRFGLVPFDELEPDAEPFYLVDEFIPRTGLFVAWGPRKCGKSFWLSDLALHVALGWEYRGRKVEAGAVVYFAFEGASGFKKRAKAFRTHYGIADRVPFYLVSARADLVKDHVRIISDIRSQMQGAIPALVVFDTLNRSLVGSEGKDSDMAAYIRAADAVWEAFGGCAVGIVHHCGLEESRYRGHTSLGGAVEAEISISRDAVDNIIARVEFMKDGPSGAEVVSRLERKDVGQDKNGKTLDSCVVLPVEGAAVRSEPSRRSNSRRHRALHDAVVEALDSHGSNITMNGSTVRAVDVEHVRSQFYRRYIVATDENTKDPQNARRMAFARALETLPDNFGMGEIDGQRWIWGA